MVADWSQIQTASRCGKITHFLRSLLFDKTGSREVQPGSAENGVSHKRLQLSPVRSRMAPCPR
jgi:hypothetical protein